MVDIGDLAILIAYLEQIPAARIGRRLRRPDYDSSGAIDVADLGALGKVIVFDAGKPFDVMETGAWIFQNAMASAH